MLRRGNALPTRMSASAPLTTFCPTFNPSGCRMYRFSPSAYASSAMRDERFGSYSIVVTVAGIPLLSRLKSMMRSLRLWPPPINRIVVSPELRRPPVRGFGSTSGLCGCLVVISSLTSVVRYRKVCVVGLYVLIGIITLLVETLLATSRLQPRDVASYVSTLAYRFCAYSGIFSPVRKRTYAFFQSGQ